jgi:hypothetical protein
MCAGGVNRGPEICSNGRLVHRDRLEDTVLQLIFEKVFSPETVAYVSRKVNEILAARADPRRVIRRRRAAELPKSRTRLDNIKAAILEGIRTPSTKQMLETAERRVAELEAAIQPPPLRRQIAVLASVVEA